MTDPHGDRVRRVEEVYPHLVHDIDWAIALTDEATIGLMIRDLITVGHATGRSGPREVPDLITGMRRLREFTGDGSDP